MAGLYPILVGLFLLTLLGAFAGMRLAEIPSISRRILPFSGGLLVGIALFWILPEIAERNGWLAACAGLIAGFSLLFLIDRYLYAVCPTCSHTHHHEDCSRSLHGFAAPLLIASGLHSFFDGWSLAVSRQAGFESLKVAFLIGIGVHKLPEGLALGALLIAALGTEWRAMLGATAAQCMMLVGGVLGALLAGQLAPTWTAAFLSVAAGAFVYLGYHAVDSEYQQRGFRTAWMPALTGAAGAAVLRVVVPGV
jgi:zinc transporter ZupT